MEANKLRLGNLIQDKEGRIETVFELSIIGDLHRINELDPEYYFPIHLTEDWLLKFGYVGRESMSDDKKYFAFKKGVHEIWFPFNKFIDNIYRFEIKYVHQLQNLYFALTGEELTINHAL